MRITLSTEEARRLALSQQGLIRKHSFGRGKNGTLKAIEHLGYIQIDTISVVERAHHHTLWSRLPNYTPKFLQDLQVKDKKVFEYWSHAAAFLPMSSFRYCLPQMKEIEKKESYWFKKEKKLMDFVLDRIKAEGPLQAKDFQTPEGYNSGPWDWKPAKKALHHLFMEGKIMIKSRKGFQKVYDLTERVLPDDLDISTPTAEEFCEHHILNTINAHGLAEEKEFCYLRKGIRPKIKATLKKLEESGEIISIQIKDASKYIYYSTKDCLDNMPKKIRQKQLHFLSPFDNAIIQRKRIENLFNFNYQTEIYLPEQKRVYGYFSLPILFGTEFIGRINPKADRKTKTLHLDNLVFENGLDEDEIVKPLTEKIVEFAHFNKCQQVEITGNNGNNFLEKIEDCCNQEL
ncbi:winged helix-turn-helix domain-containing protein [Flexithrix dorotheae]|uniref:winged helix-turn-helix domain-containing protein n=1 Tax=Flexithrix dorotheae TaxID=70993 RepID=UPI0003A4AD52|nr:crosslink repair DNA glycosylase YcaQ family protein [Flexithrix dorotheae]